MRDQLDPTRAHPARRYDWLLGGKDHFAADRESGEQLVAAYPGLRTAILENRDFLRRAVTYLTRTAGIRQFLDIGTGLPTRPNVHQVAQEIAPETRVIYVDNDPLVLVHARALLTSSPEGRTNYVDADLREPDRILQCPEVTRTLDMSQPVALLLLAIMHFVPDDMAPYEIVRRLVGALPPGSYLAMSHATNDFLPAHVRAGLRSEIDRTGEPFQARSRDEFARFFTGLHLVEPGITLAPDWHRDERCRPRPDDTDAAFYCAVARTSGP